MSEEDWNSGFAKSLGVFMNGEGIASPDAQGNRIVDDSFYLIFNAHYEAVSFKIPAGQWGRRWARVLDTDKGFAKEREQTCSAGDTVEVPARSLFLFKRIE